MNPHAMYKTGRFTTFKITARLVHRRTFANLSTAKKIPSIMSCVGVAKSLNNMNTI